MQYECGLHGGFHEGLERENGCVVDSRVNFVKMTQRVEPCLVEGGVEGKQINQVVHMVLLRMKGEQQQF